MKRLLLLGFLCFIGTSYAQEMGSLKSKISEKEVALEKAATSSRQVNNTLKEELKELYVLRKEEIEKELNSISDEALISAKKEELKRLNEKIESYSLKK